MTDFIRGMASSEALKIVSFTSNRSSRVISRRDSDIGEVFRQIREEREHEVPVLNCPPWFAKSLPTGLDLLDYTKQIYVKERLNLLDNTCLALTREFDLFSIDTGQRIFYATENSGCLQKSFLRSVRPFTLEVSLSGSEGGAVFTAKRRFKCCVWMCMLRCFCWKYCSKYCRDSIEVYGHAGEYFGKVVQRGSCIRPCYSVASSDGSTHFNIIGPCCVFECYGCKGYKRANFHLYDVKNEQRVGVLFKEHSGILKDAYPVANAFVVEFPESIDVKMKVVLLAAVFLLNTTHFT